MKRLYFLYSIFLLIYTSIAYTQCVTYTVKACIDGSDELHIQNNQMWWNHLTFTPPGQSSDCSGILSVNGVNWNPWNNTFTLPNSVQCYSLSNINVISCRSNCALTQSPNPSNNWETIYLLDDNAPSGAAVYEIVFTFCPTFPVLSVTSTSVSCNGGNNGSAAVNASGGIPPYSYTWSPTGGNSSTAGGLSAGVYTVTVASANGCSQTATVNIIQPPPLQIVSVQTQSVTCYGGSDGSATVTVNGENPPYSYTWTPSVSTGSIATGLSAGTVQPNPSLTYTVSVSDVNNCSTITTTLQIKGPPKLMPHVLSYTNVSCNGANDGGVSILTTGGVGYYPGANLTYTYSFNPSSYTVATTNATVSNLSPALYTVTVYDANGCSDTVMFNITEPSPLTLTIVQQQSVSCYGGYDGIASATVSGGTSPYTYYWYDASGNIVANQPTANFLPAGTYSLNVTDFNGCSTGGAVSIIQPNSPVSMAVSDTVSQGNCALAPSNTVFVIAQGGMGNYTYTSTPSAITASVNSNVPSGTYTISVSDMNGCSNSTTYVINLPPAFTCTASPIQTITCNGFANGSATVTITGGSGAYTATWMPVNQQGLTMYNLTAGIYTVFVKDSRGCVINDTVLIPEPQILQITSIQSNPALCGNANGGATVTATGGMPPYTYTWSSVPVQTNSVAFGLTGGTTYSVFVEDQNNCIVWDTIFIPAPLPPLITSANYTAPLCYGDQNGAATVNFINGQAPISINWQPGNIPTSTIYNIGAGIYTVTLTDANGCQTYTTIVVPQPPSLSLQINPSYTICYGRNATIQAMPNGGTPPYSYTWSNPSFNGSGPHNIALTATTVFSVEITDANGCQIGPVATTINVLPPLLASGMSTTICHNDNTSIWATITSPGNGGPYTYTWNTGATTLTTNVVGFYPSQPNTYTVIISDGCSIPDAVAISTVNVNPLPNGYFKSDFVSGCPPLKVWFQAVSNGVNDTYQWDLGNGETATGDSTIGEYTAVGTYSVKMTITNQYGCKIDTIASDYITVHPNPISDFEIDKYETTIFDPTFILQNMSTGASQYLWDFGAPNQPNNLSAFPNPIHTYVFAGEYNITLIAINTYGCTDRTTKKVIVHPDYLLYIPNAFSPDGNGVNDVFQPKGIGILETPYKMEIYDRWGELIFKSENFNEGWNGSIKGKMNMAKNDVYVYKIIVYDLLNKPHPYIGHVTLIGNSN